MTDANTLNLIEDHFTWVAAELNYLARQAGLLTNPSGVGTEREKVYQRFLKRHVPKMCDVFLGGYVFDAKGNRSRQIDIIVTGGNTPRFRMSSGNRYIAPLEGTIAVVEVKSRLDKSALMDAMNNSLALPPMPDGSEIIPPDILLDDEAWTDSPYKIVFAYDGIELDSLIEHLKDFLKDPKNQVAERLPNIIHVLGKYTIRKVYASQIRDMSTSKVAEGNKFAYHIIRRNWDVLTMMEILNTIQQGAFVSNYLKYDYSEWNRQIFEKLQQER